MGTNYYTVSNYCEQCNRSDRDLHIGKSSGGWTFSFRGYRAEYEHLKIESYTQWLEVLKDARICDEYGDTISLTDFQSLVEAKRGEKFNHTTYCLNESNHRRHAIDHCWLDEEGNSFSDTEFS